MTISKEQIREIITHDKNCEYGIDPFAECVCGAKEKIERIYALIQPKTTSKIEFADDFKISIDKDVLEEMKTTSTDIEELEKELPKLIKGLLPDDLMFLDFYSIAISDFVVRMVAPHLSSQTIKTEEINNDVTKPEEIEGLKKELKAKFHKSYTGLLSEEQIEESWKWTWSFFAPHLSNKPASTDIEEVRKEYFIAVGRGKIKDIETAWTWFVPHLSSQSAKTEEINKDHLKVEGIGELRKEFYSKFPEFKDGSNNGGEMNIYSHKDIFDFFAPHLSNKSELKKEAVIENEVVNKLLASINSFLAENGIKDADGTPLTFSPERIQEWEN